MKSIGILCISILLFGGVLAYAQVPAGDMTVVAEGNGTSKNAALLDAKRNAVEQGVGTILISETEMKNFRIQKDTVLSRTIGSVKKIEVLDESALQDNTVYVKIQAVVSLEGIKSDLVALKILLESMDKPRMMVVIEEKDGKTAEGAILDYLEEKGFELVDAALVAALMQKEEALIRKATEGDPVAAARIGASNGAEYVIVGKVTKSLMQSPILGDTGMRSGQVNITARVVNCSTAIIIASKSENGAAVHVSEEVAKAMAAEKAAKKLMDNALFEKIVSSFQDQINNGIPLDVTVTNVSDFNTQKAVGNTLGKLANVVTVNRRSFSKGQLKLSVLYKGNADSFSEAVDGKTIQGKRMSVSDIQGSRVVIDLE